jgi:hypothetical protein
MHNKLCPQYLCNCLPPTVSSINDHNFRNNENFTTLRSRLRMYLTSFIPSTVSLWNNLDLNVRNINTNLFPMFHYIVLYIIYIYVCARFVDIIIWDKGNNKITELRTIFLKESQNSLVYKQKQSVNNRKTGKTVMILTWYRHLQKKWWVGQIRF